jgi:hypothetical protein
MKRMGCRVATGFTVGEYTHLAGLDGVDDVAEWFTWRELEGGHDGPHWAMGRAAGSGGAWWLRWHPTARELLLRPFCPAASGDPELLDTEACTLPEGHTGRHDYEYTILTGHPDRRPPALTAGALRRAMEGLADDAPVRIGAATDGVLPVDTEVLLAGTAMGRADVPDPEDSRLSNTRDALVLLAGLGVRPDQKTAG